MEKIRVDTIQNPFALLDEVDVKTLIYLPPNVEKVFYEESQRLGVSLEEYLLTVVEDGLEEGRFKRWEAEFGD